MPAPHPPRPLNLVVVLLALVLAACGGSSASPSGAGASASPSSGIVRELFGSAEPSTAPGQQLALWHYTIAPGSKLPPHHHPGWQVAHITAGTLTYTVLTGEVAVTRADGAAETHRAGETIQLAAGDAVVENPSTDHFGANEGSVAVELYTATLFENGKPPAIVVATSSPSN